MYAITILCNARYFMSPVHLAALHALQRCILEMLQEILGHIYKARVTNIGIRRRAECLIQLCFTEEDTPARESHPSLSHLPADGTPCPQDFQSVLLHKDGS